MARPGWENIDHVVVLVQENLSFDRVFGWMRPGPRGGEGVPDGLAYPIDDPLFPPGTVLRPEPGAALVPPGAPHLPWDMAEQMHGRGYLHVMLRRAKSRRGLDEEGKRELVREVLRYHRRDDLPVYRDLAESFAVADRWFAPMASSTLSNRYFLHLGTSPTGPAHLPELDGELPTLYDRLTEAGLGWRVYVNGLATIITSRSVLRAGRRARRRLLRAGLPSEEAEIFRSFDRFTCDVSRSAALPPVLQGRVGGQAPLPTYTFIEPRHWPAEGLPADNDHHHTHLHRGQRLVATIYNALRADPERWLRTLFVVTYDEHGGYWDHVDPPPAPHPRTGERGTEFRLGAMDWYGGRVPTLLISPWIRRGPYSVVTDHTSVLAFMERRFGLAPLTQRDARADDLTAAFTDTPELGPERLDLPPEPPVAPFTGDHDQDFTAMAIDLYRDAARQAGVDPEPELAKLPPKELAAMGEARARAWLRAVAADPLVG